MKIKESQRKPAIAAQDTKEIFLTKESHSASPPIVADTKIADPIVADTKTADPTKVAELELINPLAITLNRYKYFKIATPTADSSAEYVHNWLTGWFELLEESDERDATDKCSADDCDELEYKDVLHRLSWTGSNVCEMGEEEMASQFVRVGLEVEAAEELVGDIVRARELSVSFPS